MLKRIVFVTAFIFLLGSATVTHAQNFANWRPKDKKEAAATEKPTTPADSAKQTPPARTDEESKVINGALERVAAEASGKGDTETQESSRYTLGATDEIEIQVLRHPEVSGRFQINQEGKIQYEFVGDIKLSGMTKEDAAKVIAERLAEYIISPEVSVKISGYNSKVVYVVGEVGRPGKIFMRGDTITIREALMDAGLPQLTGVTRKSRLITPSEKGKGAVKKVDVYALLYEGDLTQNFEMKPGDVIYIPATFLTKTMRALQPVAAPIGTAAGTGRTLTTGF